MGAVVGVAERTEVARIKPQVGTLTDAQHVVGVGRGFAAARNATCRIGLEERGANPTPLRIVATSRRTWAGGIMSGAPLLVTDTLALAPGPVRDDAATDAHPRWDAGH